MFPVTHLYVAQRVLGTLNPHIVLGSLFPDMAVAGLMSWNQSHRCGRPFMKCSSGNGRLAEFGLGILMHGVEPEGLDYYGDEKYEPYDRGVSFEWGKPLIPSVQETCNLPRETAAWKSHNFIEMAIEREIALRNPALCEALASAFKAPSAIVEVSEALGSCFSLDPKRIVRGYDRLQYYIEAWPDAYLKLASKYSLQLQAKHQVFVEAEALVPILERAGKIVSSRWENLLDGLISPIRGMVEKETGMKSLRG
ncbi:MAG: hypothetical protein HYU64_19190 [Armatimonadetes bacterium]|nr:hypothetical protein [Armatimonadota bacterium]